MSRLGFEHPTFRLRGPFLKVNCLSLNVSAKHTGMNEMNSMENVRYKRKSKVCKWVVIEFLQKLLNYRKRSSVKYAGVWCFVITCPLCSRQIDLPEMNLVSVLMSLPVVC